MIVFFLNYSSNIVFLTIKRKWANRFSDPP